MAGVRERHAQHLREQAEAARDGRARVVVETWEGLIRAHHAALPGIEADPGLKGTREQLLRFAHAATLHPELVHALTTRGAEFGMEKRPNLARVLADPSPERAVTALLDGVEAETLAAVQNQLVLARRAAEEIGPELQRKVERRSARRWRTRLPRPSRPRPGRSSTSLPPWWRRPGRLRCLCGGRWGGSPGGCWGG